MMTEQPFSPQAIVQKLTTEAVTLKFMHQYAEYDDHYIITYQPRRQQFKVQLEVSVWDGRGHETYKEMLDEATMLARLEEIGTKGEIRYFYYEAKK